MSDENAELRERSDERKLNEIDRLLNGTLGGPVERMDEQRVAIIVPELAGRPPGYFAEIAARAAKKAENHYLKNGELIPSHVRSALESAGRLKSASGRTSGGQIEEKPIAGAGTSHKRRILNRLDAVYRYVKLEIVERRLPVSRRSKALKSNCRGPQT